MKYTKEKNLLSIFFIRGDEVSTPNKEIRSR